MPNIRSQIKRDKQNLKRAEKNKMLKSKIKTLHKNFIFSVDENNIEEAQKDLKEYYKTLDKAVKINTIHKNTAANKKSKATKMLNRITVKQT